ncbi:methylated-DNA--[protein]-cysteine S-methyltransferase [Rathayibacter sp. YIM 133350]|uniref:methylated-DNA--[protein]-cysteine S-methyltransferase n=1 Tax=Rathayibacter sp. YIM 133350 TaxID=3131992 RepID=UPI00307F0608
MRTPATLTTVPLHLQRMESPIGRIELTSNGEHITSLSMERAGVLPHDGEPVQSDAVLEKAITQLSEYFAGERTEFDLPVLLEGTAFQRAVWEQIAALSWGQYTSYGELGLAVGRPHAGRAIGRAVGANPVPLIVGCHRVLSSSGHITGYSGGEGIPTKVWLLEHESIAHKGAAPALFDLDAVALP